MQNRDLSEVLNIEPRRYYIFENGDVLDTIEKMFLSSGNDLRVSLLGKVYSRSKLLYLSFVGNISDGDVILKQRHKPLHYKNIKKYPPDGWEMAIINGFNNGLTQREIGEQLGVCDVSIIRYSRKLGITNWRRRSYRVRYGGRQKTLHSVRGVSKFLGYTSSGTLTHALRGLVKAEMKGASKRFGVPVTVELIEYTYELVG